MWIASSRRPKAALPLREPTQQIGKPPVFPLSLPRAPVKAADGKTYKDLTAHPWAGLPVVVTLSAKDEAGHTGYSAARGLILPERKFTKPLAKAVIGQRRSLVENPSDTTPVASNLNALGITAEDEGAAPTIYLGLRAAYWRLRRSPKWTTLKVSSISCGTLPFASRMGTCPAPRENCGPLRNA